MPCDYSRYPKDWKTRIRPLILERSKEGGEYEKCEWCGLVNGVVGYRVDGEFTACTDEDEAYELGDSKRLTTIVLTIAHVFDMDKMACHPLNLAALCPRCHLLHDMDHHVKMRRENRDLAAGQGLLLEVQSEGAEA